MELIEQINAAYHELAKVRKEMRQINELDNSRMESSSIRISHERYQECKGKEADALLEIDRLKLVIQARAIGGQSIQEEREKVACFVDYAFEHSFVVQDVLDAIRAGNYGDH